jgi:hypothetical protein
MKAKGSEEIRYAIVLNFIHVAICLLCRLAVGIGTFPYAATQAAFLIADVAVWAALAAACSLGKNDLDPNGGAVFALTALSPVIFLGFLCYLLRNYAHSWAAVFLLGAPLAFYMRPLALSSRIAVGNAYAIYLINATGLIIVSIFAYAYASKLNQKTYNS